jgi:hypothetical protein
MTHTPAQGIHLHLLHDPRGRFLGLVRSPARHPRTGPGAPTVLLVRQSTKRAEGPPYGESTRAAG